MVAMACIRSFNILNIFVDYLANFHQVFSWFSPVNSELQDLLHNMSFVMIR